MLYYLLYPLRDLWFGFNVFKYLTFRAAMASVTAFVVSVICGPMVIRWLAAMNFGQHIRKEHVENLYVHHKDKQGTPTMGGILIIIAVFSSTALWADVTNRYVAISLAIFVALGIVGFVDDYIKVCRKHNEGLHAKGKFVAQAAIGTALAVFVMMCTPIPTTVAVPFSKYVLLDIGWLYLIFVVIVISGSSNAVNLTDGLDGLAIGCMVFVSLTYAILSYVAGNYLMSDYLNVFFLNGAGELSVFCAALVGAGLGFLWFNSFPATVFMGDTGSLALGGAIGTVAVLIKKEMLLLIVGGIFVAEALSVIAQVAWFKVTGRRLFRMSPIHHHFQLIGWKESKITIRFWIIAIILVLLSLSTLKLQ